jgi:DNA-binding response OmpR family regulator
MIAMIARATNQPQVFVVDANEDDYRELVSDMNQDGYRLEVCTSGRAALRRDPANPPELWVVNMNLPDMSGPDLLSMLRWRYPGVPICLVSDDYRAEDEISARCSGAELYVCKPVASEWLTAATAQN